MLSAYISLVKPRTVALLLVVALASALVAAGGSPPGKSLLWLALSGGLASAGAGVLNNYLDRALDRLMPRTRERPLPSGKIRPHWALLWGLALTAMALAFSWRLSWPAPLFIALGAFIYVVIYTLWLKRRTTLNIVIGGGAGSCAALAGWFAITDQISAFPILLALLLFLWTPVHFWSFSLAKIEDYRQAGLPMLPTRLGGKESAQRILVYAGLTVLVSILIFLTGRLGYLYLGLSLALAGLFIASNLRLLRKPIPETAWSNYKLSGVYLLGLFLAIAADIFLL